MSLCQLDIYPSNAEITLGRPTGTDGRTSKYGSKDGLSRVTNLRGVIARLQGSRTLPFGTRVQA